MAACCWQTDHMFIMPSGSIREINSDFQSKVILALFSQFSLECFNEVIKFLFTEPAVLLKLQI